MDPTPQQKPPRGSRHPEDELAGKPRGRRRLRGFFSRRSVRVLLRRFRNFIIAVFAVGLAGNYGWNVLKAGRLLSPGEFFGQYALFTQLYTRQPVILWSLVALVALLVGGDILLEWRARHRKDSRAAERDLFIARMVEKYKEIPLVVGSEVTPEVRMQLQDVFQTLILRKRTAQEGLGSSGDAAVDERALANSVLDALGKGSRRIVILGAPGSGKTTLLYYSIALQQRGAGEVVPIYLRLPDLARAFNASGELIPGVIAEILQQQEPFLATIDEEIEHHRDIDAAHPGPYAAHLERLILAGKALLYLDALDEIDDAGRRGTVARWITGLPSQPAGAIVVTSRLADFASNPFKDRFTEWQVREITHDARVALATALFEPFKRELHISAPRNALDFVSQLERHAKAAEWGGNPLLFSLAAYAFVAKGDLPPARSALYGTVVDALIAAKDHDRIDERRWVLGELALALYQSATPAPEAEQSTKQFATRELAALLSGVYDRPAETGVMVEWVKNPGILDDAGEGLLRFRHKTFQEYLLAVALARRLIKSHLTGDGQMHEATWQLLRSRREGDLGQWLEPLRLFAGELCGEHNRTTGAPFARQWLDETFARYAAGTDERLLGLVLASCAEVPELALLGADFPLPAILGAWSQAVLAAAGDPESDRYQRSQAMAESVRVLPGEVTRPVTTERFLGVLSGAAPPEQRDAALEALAGLRVAVPIEEITPFLTGGATPAQRRMAALVLLRQGKRGEPVVLAALQSDDARQRQAVAQALADAGEEGRPVFLAALQNDDEQVRQLAAEAVSTIPEPTRGDIAEDLDRAHPRREWALPILRALTAPEDTTAETWRLFASYATGLGDQRRALAAMAARGADAALVADTKRRILPPPIHDRARFPQRLEDLDFESFVIGGVEVIVPPLALIPAGIFQMGSDKSRDHEAYDYELPQHSVALDRYEMARFPLTVAEYACAVRAKAVGEPPKPSYNDVTWQKQLGRLDHPVVNVSWRDILAFVDWLRQVTGESWRMPTEAEWEKAARGTDGRIYPWGDQWDALKANTSEAGKGSTTPVGAYPQGASPYGCLDMAGNVWEWTSSLYQSYPYRADDGRENPQSTGNRVLRGGSWYSSPRNARAAYRFGSAPDVLYVSRGFRLARGAGAGSS